MIFRREPLAWRLSIKGEEYHDADGSEAVSNILARYADLEDLFAEDLGGAALPYFVDWLMENVHLVEITAYSDEDAYTIFETMNDRGLSLTPADMLKGYLLANISDSEKRNHANFVWKEQIRALGDLGKDEDADGIKSWLRSQYALSIRDRKQGAKPQDFDLLGTEFHRWVRDNEERLGLTSSSNFARFIERDFSFYAHWYETLRKAADTFTAGLEYVFFNAQHNFTLQYPVLLAPLRLEDDDAAIRRKIRIVSAYIDILIHRRIWNWRSIDYSTMQYAMFLVMRDIRSKSAAELVEILKQRLDAESETFATNSAFRLHGMNGRQIHRLLARMTDYVETNSGFASHYAEYAQRGKKGYEIEHIWQTTPSFTPTNSPIRTSFRIIATASAAFFSCPKASMPATAISPTRRNFRTIFHRTCWRAVFTSRRISTIRDLRSF